MFRINKLHLKPVLWRGTATKDHLSWETIYSWCKDLNINTIESVTRDHLSWGTIFSGRRGSHSRQCLLHSILFPSRPELSAAVHPVRCTPGWPGPLSQHCAHSASAAPYGICHQPGAVSSWEPDSRIKTHVITIRHIQCSLRLLVKNVTNMEPGTCISYVSSYDVNT